jgi:hypothetical protein
VLTLNKVVPNSSEAQKKLLFLPQPPSPPQQERRCDAAGHCFTLAWARNQ